MNPIFIAICSKSADVSTSIYWTIMSNNIYSYIDKYLSTRLCGFRKDHSAQLSLIIMLEEIRKNLDKGNFSGILLTDLSKAFDCLCMIYLLLN